MTVSPAIIPAKKPISDLEPMALTASPPSFEPDEIENEPTPEVYRRYQVFCAENSLQPMGNVVFTKQICKRLKLRVMDTRIDGKKTRIYVKDE